METTIEQQVMRRVRRIYYLKKVCNPLMFKVYAFVAVLAGTSSLVSFTQIVKNMPPLFDVGSAYHFFTSAFFNTETTVQIALGIGVLLIAFFVRDAVRNFSQQKGYATH